MANTIQLRRSTSSDAASGGSGTSSINAGEPLVYIPGAGDSKLWIAKSTSQGDVEWIGAPISTDAAETSATKLMTASAIQSAIDTADAISELGDVAITSIANTQALLYDSTLGKWENKTFSGAFTVTKEGVATLGDNSVDSDMYVDGSIDNAHLADDAVNSDEIAAGAIDLAHMSANSVDSDQYVDGSIDLAHMSANSVDSDQYVDGSIDTAHLADNVVTLAKMAGLDRGHIIYGDASGDPASLANSTTDGHVLTVSNANGDIGWEAVPGASGEANESSYKTFSVSGQSDVVADSATDTMTFVGAGGMTITTNASSDTITFTSANDNDNTQLSNENVEDIVGGMVTSTNDETGITVTYQDATGDIDFTVSDTTVAGDSGSTGITPGDTLTIAGTANEVTTVMSGDTLTVGLPDNVTIGGNLTVSGTTTTVNSTTVSIADPLFELGASGSDDNLDRGIIMKYNSSGAKKAFMGFDDSTGKFTMIADATDSSSVISGTAGTLVMTTFEGALTGNASTASTAAAWTTARAFTTTGDVVVASTNWDGSAGFSAAATIQSGAVELSMMADNSVDSDQYVDGSIDLAHMSANSVDSDQYVDGSIDTAHIANDAITADLIADNAIDSDMYVDGSIDNAHLADDAVNSDEIAAGAIDLAHMSANSVDSDQYVDGSIDLAHMSANSVDSDQYVDGSVDNVHLANSTISGISLGSNLAALTVDNTTVQLNTGTTFTGASGVTISAKTATIADGGAALATADQIHTFVAAFNIDGGAI